MKAQDPGTSLKVIIADDHVLFRAGVKTALSLKKDIRIIGEADNGQQLLHLLKHLEPDVILLDIQMPVMDGITTLPEIKKLYPDIRIIMLTMHNDHSMISRLMELGANAYLTKNSDSEVIYEAIRTCYTNEYYFNDLTNKALLDGLRTKRNADTFSAAEVKLSEKEKHILKLMCDEKSTKEIADMVDLSPRTVEAIRDKLKSKTGVKSMAGLVMYAVKSGIIENK
ncbi:MAG TPA: response regulator transcription factor [Agriterribacter sp.]|nr:response regulator transcription factor [Agriterribacter sp.]